MNTSEETIKRQVTAYNATDIDTFANLHHTHVELFSVGESIPYLSGRVAVHEYYGKVFSSSPNLHTEIINRMVLGNTVIDHEIVTGREGADKLEIIAIYEIEDELIKKVTCIRK